MLIEILIESVGARLVGRQVDGALFRLAHLPALGREQQRASHRIELRAVHPAGQVDAGRDVAPLIAAADLQLAAVLAR